MKCCFLSGVFLKILVALNMFLDIISLVQRGISRKKKNDEFKYNSSIFGNADRENSQFIALFCGTFRW